ncbi:MAG: acetyl-CoA acetyltransferase [Bacteroidetes bacterium B1(2017)]|nr:MAG: acetyl-CoA acetyltransferase [Bacteroidetes bacterium B1(2017)]
MKTVYIVSAVRTPIGAFNGSLAAVSAPQLGAVAIKGALAQAGIAPEMVQEVFMGNVISAGMGQAPATQAMIYAGIPYTVPATVVNKVCASGSKAIMMAAQTIMLGINDVVVAGGMESMSNIPYYLDKARNGYRLGHGTILDGMVKDGLWDVYNDYHMGNAAELCAREYKFTREDQDAFAIESYTRAQNAYANNAFANELVSVEIPVRGKDPIIVSVDEEYTKVNFDKLKTLKPAFEKEGTITAANASKLNDGASALVLMSEEKVKELGLTPLAKIIAFADAAQAPEWFTTAPALAVPKALKWAGVDIKDVDFFELNEAFSVVGLVNTQLLGIDAKKVNARGGAVALGHPLGSSGSRIVVSLAHLLKAEGGRYGVTGICNGGGGASAIVIENVK